MFYLSLEHGIQINSLSISFALCSETSSPHCAHSIDLKIPRAYLPTEPYKVPGGVIESVDIVEDYINGEIEEG